MPLFIAARSVQRWFFAIDRNALGLGFFRHDAQQVDAEQAIGQAGSLHFDVICQAERQLEGALCDTLVQVGHFSGAIVALATGHGQDTFFDLQVEVLFLEASCSNDDSVVVFAMFFNIASL